MTARQQPTRRQLEVLRAYMVAGSVAAVAHAHGLAVVLPEVVLACPAGAGDAGAARRIVRIHIVGKREWLKLARSA